MRTALKFLAASLTCLVTLSFSASADDWPGFRGTGSGISDDKGLPEKCTAENILWKAKLPGLGASSPITYGDKIFVTCYTGYGTKLTKGFSKKKGGGGKEGGAAEGNEKDLKFLLVCLDRKKGDILWQKEIAPKHPEHAFTGFLREHGYASSTPVTDGERVYVFFGKSGVAAFDMDGQKVWHVGVGAGTDDWGSGTSPIVYKNMVIVNAVIESNALVALDKKTGEELWRIPDMATNWVSPLIVETKDGSHELVMSLPGKVVGYDPKTGKELWFCDGIGKGSKKVYTCSTPVARDGIVYAIGGGGPMPTASLAVRTGGRGDVTKTHVIWKQKAGSSICSPVLSGDYLIWVSGTANCLNIADGKIVYQERLYDSRSEYVSTVSAGGKIYALTRLDGMFVIGGGDTLDKVSHIEFENDPSIFNASPAISNGRIYVRSNEYLYCIGKK